MFWDDLTQIYTDVIQMHTDLLIVQHSQAEYIKKAIFMQKRFLIIIFLSFFLVLGVGCEVEQSIQKTPVQEQPVPSQESQIQEPSKSETPAIKEVPPSSVETNQKNEEEKTFLVTRVIDGDTIEIEGGQKIRYIGIDTPETIDPRKPVQCFGVEASNRNKQLVESKKVRLEKDVGEIDKYGRLLRYVYVDDVFVNLLLVQEGFAYSYTYPPDVKYQDQFTEAEKIAREQNKGLWGSCPALTPTPITIPTPTPLPTPATCASWTYSDWSTCQSNGTKTRTIISSSPSGCSGGNPDLAQSCDYVPQTSAPQCLVKGNVSSSGEKIYHVPGCGSYNVTKIDEARGEKWFCTEEEAAAAGWRKAKNCP